MTIPITQADREAAGASVRRRLIVCHGMEMTWMDEAIRRMTFGEQDDHPEVIAFAAHRVAAEKAQIERDAVIASTFIDKRLGLGAAAEIITQAIREQSNDTVG